MEIKDGGGHRIKIYLTILILVPILILVLILTFPPFSYAGETIKINFTTLNYNRIIYVDSLNGSDTSGNGSINKPYQSFEKALSVVSDGDAIKLAGGTYTVISSYFTANFDIIGEKENTTLVFNPPYRFFNEYTSRGYFGFKSSVKFYDLIITTRGSDSYANYFNNSGNVSFYNVVFSNFFTVDYACFQNHSGQYHFYNCTVDSISGKRSDSSGGFLRQNVNNSSTLTLQNCYGNITVSSLNYPNAISFITSMIRNNPQLDSTYHILESGWEDAGTGTDPDGTQADIGAYGGTFAWGNWTPNPPAPTGLTVSNVTSTGATVTWDPVSGAKSYNVYLNDFLYAAYVTGTSYDITGLDPGTNYTVRVTTVISNVEGEPATTTFTTLVDYKPKLTVRVDSRQIIMSWESMASSFIVEANGQQIATTSDKQYTYTAEPGTYELRVIAMVDGEQHPSDPVTVAVSALNTPGVVQTAKDILGNTAAVIFPFGGLIALGLALKGSGWLMAVIRMYK